MISYEVNTLFNYMLSCHDNNCSTYINFKINHHLNYVYQLLFFIYFYFDTKIDADNVIDY